MTRSLVHWYVSLGAVALPVLTVGLLMSALANRLVYAAWGLVATALYAGVLRYGWEAGWRPPARLGGSLIVLAAGCWSFGVLVSRHHEGLELGFRAFLPGFFSPLLIEPRTIHGLGVLFALTAAGLLVRYVPRRRQHEDEEQAAGDSRQ